MPKWTKARPVKPKPFGEEDYPTVDEINELPDKFRRYIHDLATRADKTDDLRTIVQLRQDREALQRRVEELEAEVASLSAKRLESPNFSSQFLAKALVSEKAHFRPNPSRITPHLHVIYWL
jgi:seryl-tRNA synthetase